jgi:periplasmic nitrate reductase NapD
LSAELHVSSLVLQARPAALVAVADAIRRMPGARVHAVAEQGKMVVTLETVDESVIVDRMNEMSLLPGVLSAALVYHQVEYLQEKGTVEP